MKHSERIRYQPKIDLINIHIEHIIIFHGNKQGKIILLFLSLSFDKKFPNKS